VLYDAFFDAVKGQCCYNQ